MAKKKKVNELNNHLLNIKKNLLNFQIHIFALF
jgi:hypothetical protein